MEIKEQLSVAKGNLDRLASLRANLAPARERLAEKAYRTQGIENSLREIGDRIDALKSLTFSAIIESLLWRKEKTLNALMDELAQLESEHAAADSELTQLERDLAALEQEVLQFPGAEATYKKLCQERCQEILARRTASATELAKVLGELDEFKVQRQALRKAQQIGKHTLERLDSMINATGRARSKMLRGAASGILIHAAVNAVQGQSAAGAVKRVHEGLTGFGESIAGLRLRQSCESDSRLAQLGALLRDPQGSLAAEFSVFAQNSAKTSAVTDHLMEALAILDDMLEEVELAAGDLERRRDEVITSAE